MPVARRENDGRFRLPRGRRPPKSNNAPRRACHERKRADHHVQRRHIGGLVRPNRPRAQADLRQDQAEPKYHRLCQKIFSAKPPPSQPGAYRDQNGDRERHDAMRHLQADLKSRDGIFAPSLPRAVDCSAPRNPHPSRARLCHKRGENRGCKAGVFMPHRRRDDELRENQKRRHQNQRTEIFIGGARHSVRAVGGQGTARPAMIHPKPACENCDRAHQQEK